VVKFLEGGSFQGDRVPVCTYWRSDVTTDPEQDYAPIEGTTDDFDDSRTGGHPIEGDPLNRALGSAGTPNGQCIANAFFARDEITCFNEGNCNGTGQCLPCSKYRFEGMQIGITHSPPLDILRQFDKGLTEDDLQSPNLVRFPPDIVTAVAQDQIPYHILLKNIMARIAKCCHWNQGDGASSEFFLGTILNGPETRQVTDVNGNQITIKGIVVTNDVFPDEVGTFFPVGTVVVAGFSGQPSFYLEPRTGLIKPGEGIIFSPNALNGPRTSLKTAAANATQPIIDTVNTLGQLCNDLTVHLGQQANFINNALKTNDPDIIASAQAKFAQVSGAQQTVCNNASAAQAVGQEANDLITEIVDSPADTPLDDLQNTGQELAAKLSELAVLAEQAAVSGLGFPSAETLAAQAGGLRRLARQVSFAGFGAFSKCEFFFEDNNVAKQWNFPEDGTLPCNGVRTDCDFYTGEEWEFATDENLETGQAIKAEYLQEVRFRSDDWAEISNPAEEFRNRFSIPFIWAFKNYTATNFQPDAEDLILYRPKVLLGNDTDVSTRVDSEFETIVMEKVTVDAFDDFSIGRSRAPIKPGSDSLDLDQPPQFPTTIFQPTVPSSRRIRITHPSDEEQPFIYRMWTPDKNKFTLFGVATPDTEVYIVNKTALQNRQRYHDFLGTQNFISSLPTSLPNLDAVITTELRELFLLLEDESRLSDSEAPLGFHLVETDNEGFWQSIETVDLVHGEVNEIFAILLVDDIDFIYDSTEVEARFLHSIPVQLNFEGKDFAIADSLGDESKFGTNAGDTAKTGKLTAEVRKVMGNENILFDHGYMAWRNRERGLQFGTLNADSDLLADNPVADQVSNLLVSAAASGNFITSVTYQVVQYRKTGIDIPEWYLVNDCGFIMIKIPDTTANRVLPLPDQAGNSPSLSNILVNGGAKGSIVAQFALEKATLTIEGEEKNLVQVYRNPDGLGLPANYILLGPSPDVEQAFGRPVPSRDSITIDYTYLKTQTALRTGEESEPEEEDEVVSSNFYADNFKDRNVNFTFDPGSGALSAGGDAPSPDSQEDEEEETPLPGEPQEPIDDVIRRDQQDYCWVFADSEGRPIGRKVSRMMVMYYNLSAISVEIFYHWTAACTTYALAPDLRLQVGTNAGALTVGPKGTIDPDELELGSRVESLLGEQTCTRSPSCGDHEFLQLGPIRLEFEVITIQNPEDDPLLLEDFELKAIYPSAGQSSEGEEIFSTSRPGTQFLEKRGPLWYPYITCERPRYQFRTNGPLGTDSTELINEELEPAGIPVGENVPSTGEVEGSGGQFGLLVPQDLEPYHGPDKVAPKLLDVHPSLRPCTSAFTYGNSVLTGGSMSFTGAARRRGEVDLFWYENLGWRLPPFGNFGRGKLLFEIGEKVGDYLGGIQGNSVGFRWMPMFPEREDIRATTELFSEDMEPQHLRLIQISNPVGGLGEQVNEGQRFTHKGLIQNIVGGGSEYPFINYYPSFIPDIALGLEPLERTGFAEDGVVKNEEITTMWAWREKEKPVQRGLAGNILGGVRFSLPDYFIDNRRLEAQIRPGEGNKRILFIPPEYDETGNLVENAAIQLGDGPPREIVIDFAARILELADQEDTVYDTSKVLGDGPFPCTPGSASDNLRMGPPCSCIGDIDDPGLQPGPGSSSQLPARFLHLDELAPDGFAAIYESTNQEEPFVIDIERQEEDDPCCMCIYYIRGIFFSLDLEFLPAAQRLDPAFDDDLAFEYTWSRPPHGVARPDGGQAGTDGFFDAQESLSDNYLNYDVGEVFLNRFISQSTQTLEIGTDLAAGFPSRELALSLQNEDGSSPLAVKDVDPSELKPGATPATDGFSNGQDERIVLDMRFPTYVKMRSINITFFAGQGWQVPRTRLAIVDHGSRQPGAPDPTLRVSRIVAESEKTANGTSVPDPEFLDRDAIRDGLESGVGAKFTVTLTPSFVNQPFWNQFGQEYHLIFDRRDEVNSMGIAGIEMQVEAMLPDTDSEEIIGISERKYFISSASPTGGNNPEEHLETVDSATTYWRTAEQNAQNGANKFRTYAFGPKLVDESQQAIQGEPRELEQLQVEEYNNARNLLNSPYVYVFQSFFPSDETEAVDFYGGTVPSWINTLEAQISEIDEVRDEGSGDPIYGEIPEGRNPWHAPGHAWVYTFDSTFKSYVFCCFPCPKQLIIDYEFAHLHDNLAPVETARFWDELPAGFTRLLRSTMMNPDPRFGSGESTVGTDGQLVEVRRELLEGIDITTMENAGFFIDERGELVIAQGGE